MQRDLGAAVIPYVQDTDFTANLGLAYHIARDYHLPGADNDDVRQEAALALWLACNAWDPERGVPFGPFAALVIRRALGSALRVANSGRAAFLTDAVRELDGDLIPAANTSPHQIVEMLEELRRVRRAARMLTPLERETVGMLLDGVRFSHSKRHDNALGRARKKLAA